MKSTWRASICLASLTPSVSGMTTSVTSRSQRPVERARLAGRARDGDVVALVAQHLREQVAHDLLVVDDEDPLGAAARARRRPRLALRSRPTADRQANRERRALARGGADVDRAAALRDDAVDGREPEARARADGLRREERLEDAARVSLVHADARVGDLEHDVTAVVARRDRQRAAAGHRVARVDGEVQQHLADLARVGLDGSQFRLEVEVDAARLRRSGGAASTRSRAPRRSG